MMSAFRPVLWSAMLWLWSQAAAPTAQDLFRDRRYAEAAARLASSQSRGDRYLLGLCYQQLGELGKAETVLARLVAREPKWAPAAYALARVLFVEGKFPDALAMAARAEALGEPRARTRRLMGSIEEERANWTAALTAYEEAIAADAAVSEAHSARASVLFKMGRIGEARAAAERALELAPANAEAARVIRQAKAVPPAMAAGPRAVDVTFQRIELPFVLEHSPTPEKHVVSTMAGGVAIFDYDRDGLPDLFFTNGAELPSLRKSAAKYANRLYRNLGQMKFVDVTQQAGLAGEGFSIGAAPADFDGDGWVDLFVAGAGRNLLYRNDHGRFTLSPRGLKDEKFSVGGLWLDYDRDGRLDLFVVNYIDWTPAFSKYCGDLSQKLRVYCHPREYAPAANRLYRNLGDGRFADVSNETGLAALQGKGMSASAADIDGDGVLEIFIANDTMSNFLLRYRGGRFTDIAIEAGVAYNDLGQPVSSMGSDLRDYDNDGRPDLVFTALVGETFPLFRNTGGMFQDVTYPSGVGAATVRRSGWGVALADLNNDGWRDLVTANSHVTDTIEQMRSEKYREPNLVLLSEGGRFRMGAELGPPAAYRGLAVADLDGDGRLDLVTTALGEKAAIWRNTTAGAGQWLTVPAPIGARVRAGDQWQEVSSGGSYGSASLMPAHFGMGSAVSAEVEVLHPDGRKESRGLLATKRPSASPGLVRTNSSGH
jgi:tetratricopeptide (TPR) repeat protein